VALRVAGGLHEVYVSVEDGPERKLRADKGSVGPSETFGVALAAAEHSMEWKPDGRSLTASVRDIYLLEWNGGPFQRWLFDVQDDGRYTIAQKATGRVLT